MKTFKILMMAVFSIMYVSVIAQGKAGKKDTTRNTILYTCPMHPEVEMKKAGHCPQCGMQLQVSKKEEMKNAVVKNYTCPVHTQVISDKPGNCSKCGMHLNLSPKEKMKMEVMKTYTCPMHPDVTSDKPGKCPKCGMEMKEKKKDGKS